MPTPQYQRNQPVATDNLSTSVTNLTNNTNASDNSFGVDHYPFSNTTPNNGFHNTVTQPAYNNPIGTPSPTRPLPGINPFFFAFQDSPNLPVLQYTMNSTNPAPTPLGLLHGGPYTLAPSASQLVLDFTGLNSAMFIVSWANIVPASNPLAQCQMSYVTYLGNLNGFVYNPVTLTGPILQLIAVGNILALENISSSPLTNVFINVQFMRIN